MDQKKQEFYPSLILHPGEHLKDVLNDKEISQKELAIRTGVSEKHISTILSGQKNITKEFAKKLEYATGIEYSYWNNIQEFYDRQMMEYKELTNINDDEVKIHHKLSSVIEQYRKYGFIKDYYNSYDVIRKLRCLFNISNLNDISKLYQTGLFRINTNDKNIDEVILYAWEALCHNLVLRDRTKIVKEKEICDVILELKNLMDNDEKGLIKKINEILIKCGIKLYLIKNVKGAPVNGYIEKKGENYFIFLTNRGKFKDIFWFTLFHELAHIINNDFTKQYLDMDNDKEDKADKLAKEMLITKETYHKFILNNDFSLTKIDLLARKNNVPMYIVIGRLMKENYLDWNMYPDFRKTYNFD